MNYVFYKSKIGNFGDDLNDWLWPKLLQGNGAKNDYFIGIGSILHGANPAIKKLTANDRKIVFGTGIRPSYEPLDIDQSWDIRFVRGPLSARALNYDFKYIADAAYAIMQLENYQNILNTPKKYEISVMPYYKSCSFFDWKKLCDKLGFHYISPLSDQPVEQTMREIAASKVIITEAMHGAIVADILRVPWHRFILTTPHTEGSGVSEFKWMDWLQSIEINKTNDTFIQLYRKTFLNKFLNRIPNNMVSAQFFVRSKVEADILAKLAKIDHYHLSSPEVIAKINEAIGAELATLRSEMQPIHANP